MAITDGGECLHTEKERVDVRTGSHPGNAFVTQYVESGEHKVEEEINAGDETSELRPLQREHPLVDIAILSPLQIELEEFNLTGANGDGLRGPLKNPPPNLLAAGEGAAVSVVIVGPRMRTSSPYRRGAR
jgi:hypothetical protein